MTEEKNTTLEWRALYMFNKKSGKLVKSAEGRGRGTLMMWALQNTTKSRISVLVIRDTNEIEVIYNGREGCPKVDYLYREGINLCLDDYIIDDTHIRVDLLLTEKDELVQFIFFTRIYLYQVVKIFLLIYILKFFTRQQKNNSCVLFADVIL